MATSKDEVLDFLRKHTELLEEGNFDELYFMYQQMVNLVSTSLTELLMSAGIEPLDYLTHIIGNYAPNCKLITRVVIPENIKSIGYHAFNGCSELTSVVIPDSVTNMGRYAFGKLTNIKYEGTKKEWYKINKDVYWNGEIQEYTVQCLDGEIKGE